MYFGEDAGKQCVAMSLSALIYNNIKGIHSCNDLVQIIEIVINYGIQHCHSVQGSCI